MSDPAKPSDVPDLTKAAEAFVREATRVLAEHQGGAGQSAQEIANEWVRLAQAGLQRNLTLLTELVQARSPQTVTDVQSRILRENMDALVQDSARLAELMTKANREAAERLTSQRRAIMSRLAHQGEPPDYGSDNA